jgi:uncharacterized protein YjbJ (UPF0337 family)
MSYISFFRNIAIFTSRSLILLGCIGVLLMSSPTGKAFAAPANYIAASGALNQVLGKAEKDAGTAERNVGKVTGQSKGAAKQVTGRIKQDIGKAQSATNDVANETKKQANRITDKAESAKLQAKGEAEKSMGKTQNLLDKVGNKIEDTASNVSNSVKDLLQ